MANGSDGSIIIDTELDSTGFLAGSKRLERAAGGVKRMLEAIGANVQKGLSAAMPSLAKEMEQVTRGRQSLHRCKGDAHAGVVHHISGRAYFQNG